MVLATDMVNSLLIFIRIGCTRWPDGELDLGDEPKDSLGAIERLWLLMIGPMPTTASVKGAVVYIDEARIWTAKQNSH